MIFSARFVTLFALMASLPLSLAKDQDEWNPTITSPQSNTVWHIGKEAKVTWDTAARPRQITNTKGEVVLVQDGLLLWKKPLAQGFDITAGSIQFQVPHHVKPGRYQVNLFGDSYNRSPEFEIRT